MANLYAELQCKAILAVSLLTSFLSILKIYYTYYADRPSLNDSSIHMIISAYIIITTSLKRLHSINDEFGVMRFQSTFLFCRILLIKE